MGKILVGIPGILGNFRENSGWEFKKCRDKEMESREILGMSGNFREFWGIPSSGISPGKFGKSGNEGRKIPAGKQKNPGNFGEFPARDLWEYRVRSLRECRGGGAELSRREFPNPALQGLSAAILFPGISREWREMAAPLTPAVPAWGAAPPPPLLAREFPAQNPKKTEKN